MKKLWILLALFSAIPIVAQVSKPVPTPVSAAPSTCPIGNLYQITPGHSGAGNIYGNSGTGTTCAIVAGPGGTGVTGTYTDEGGASFPISVATGVGAFH